ncbi:MAG: hypothetical protein ACTHMD_18800 [Flavisolibacter sp.]
MLKDPTISFLLFFCLSLCTSCKTKTDDIYKDIDNNLTQTKTVSLEIPTYQRGTQKWEVDWIYSYIKKQTSDLGLDTIQSGYKDIQIRIWLHSWLAIKKDLVILSRTNHNWTGELITATYKYNDSLQEHLIVKKESKQIVPKSGWDNLFKSLVDLKLLTLNDMNELPNYKMGNDGIDYVFEIATKDKYRMYHYWTPSLYTNKYWQAKNVTQIAEVVQKELLLTI